MEHVESHESIKCSSLKVNCGYYHCTLLKHWNCFANHDDLFPNGNKAISHAGHEYVYKKFNN